MIASLLKSTRKVHYNLLWANQRLPWVRCSIQFTKVKEEHWIGQSRSIFLLQDINWQLWLFMKRCEDVWIVRWLLDTGKSIFCQFKIWWRCANYIYLQVDQDLDAPQAGLMHTPDALRRYYQQFLAASPEEIEVSLHIPSKEADKFIY